MTNAELIKALRNCSDGFCSLCPYDDYELSTKECEAKLMRDAADALEAAEKSIAELETQNELKDGTITAMATDIGKLQARMQTVTDCHTLEESEQHGET